MNEEILCLGCIHKDVCKYEDEYKQFRDEIGRVQQRFPLRFIAEALCSRYVKDVPKPRGVSNIFP